jgi:RNA polymerase sigma-70 factor, ECF subfamily
MIEHKGMIVKLMRSFPMQDLTEEDLWNEMYIIVNKALPTFRGESKMSTWLYRICLNTLLQFKRIERRTSEISEYSLTSSQESSYSNEQLLQSALETLVEVDRALVLMYLEGFDQKEISETFGISTQNVGVRVHRIKKQLQQWILKY